MPADQIIHIHVDAPPMPMPGAPCNGCGVCCLAEPCPIGMVVSRKRRGACVALQWSEALGRYRCGVLAAAQARCERPARWPWLGGRWWAQLWWHWVRRHIAAGQGCDANLSLTAASRPEQR